MYLLSLVFSNYQSLPLFLEQVLQTKQLFEERLSTAIVIIIIILFNCLNSGSMEKSVYVTSSNSE